MPSFKGGVFVYITSRLTKNSNYTTINRYFHKTNK